MADEKHLYLVLQGDYVPNTLPGEIWQTGIRLGLVFGSVDPIGTLPNNWDPVADTIARTESDCTINGNWLVRGPATTEFHPDDYLYDQVKPAVESWLPGIQASNQVRLRTLELAVIGAPNGAQVPAPPYAQGTPCRLEYTSGYPVGSVSTTQLPPQNSVVISHRTQQIGSHGRGRMFLPTLTSAALSGAKIQSATVDDIVEAHQALLAALADLGGGDGNIRPIVTGKPYVDYAVINSIRVGNVMDTQRRRRNRITEVYTSGAITY